MEPVKEESGVDRVAGSTLFRKSPSSRELLLYLWRNREQPISEYAIGLDVLGRREDFDPKIDSAVRVQVSRLRQRLKEYYEGEGAADAERFQIPMGEYRLEVVTAKAEVARPRRGWVKWGLGGAAALALGDNLRLRWDGARRPDLPPFWRTLLGTARAVDVIVPAPLFLRWGEQPFVVRDFRVNSLEHRDRSEVLRDLEGKLGRPQVNQLYTVATDTLAAASVSRYLEERGVTAPTLDSPAMTIDLLAKKSTVVFVGPGTYELIEERGFRTNFYLKPGAGGVLNRAPQAGELAHYQGIEYAPLRSAGYGVFARLPGKAAGTQMMLFASAFNPAVASVVTAEPELRVMEQFHRKGGAPEYFEVLVRFERNADRVLSVAMVALRAINASD